jgi:hypothetical protein
VWNKWGRLKTVVLGRTYSSDFFNDIKNNKIKSCLQKIAEETEEDLTYFEKILKDFGCEVLRPYLDNKDSIINYIEGAGKLKDRVPRAPLMPRDEQVVLGNKLYFTGKDHPAIMHLLKNYNSKDIGFITRKGNSPLAIDNDNLRSAEGPNLLLIGSDLYVDFKDNQLTIRNIETLKKDIENLRVHKLHVGGHNDALFHTLKPGVIISAHNIQDYSITFPNWDIHYITDDVYDDNRLLEFKKNKKTINSSWWYPKQEENVEFSNFVETWLSDWVGFVQESIFDLNVLVLDEHTVCLTNYNRDTFAFLKKHKIEPIIIPWRHRYFWDGGLHCLTLELVREGHRENYFPDRKNELVDKGYDRMYFRKWKEEQKFLKAWQDSNA